MKRCANPICHKPVPSGRRKFCSHACAVWSRSYRPNPPHPDPCTRCGGPRSRTSLALCAECARTPDPATIERVRRAMIEIRARQRGWTITPVMEATIQGHRAAGRSIASICREFDLSRDVVYRVLRESQPRRQA